MYVEDDLLPLSALSHLVFCERRTALIHLEQVWAENQLTTEGRILHERAHSQDAEMRGGLRIVRGLRIHSFRLGLVGMADVVEFNKEEREIVTPTGRKTVRLSGSDGWWRPAPVEYKRGKPKPDRCDEVQLCAQALCLEEMLAVTITAGAIFYGRPRRRTNVTFDTPLRQETERVAVRLHELYRSARTPPAVYMKKCRSCSLLEICRPKATQVHSSASRYIAATLREIDTSVLPIEEGES
jgi:CRISPR-associated exonuclease Cas4